MAVVVPILAISEAGMTIVGADTVVADMGAVLAVVVAVEGGAAVKPIMAQRLAH